MTCAGEGWLWWDKAGRHHQYVGIFHESYEAPLRGVESIYSGMKPTGLGERTFAIVPFPL